MGAFRVICENGLIVSRGAFPGYCVSHRGNVVEEVVAAALRIAERFGDMAAQVERMEQRVLCKDEQIRFAEKALALRYPDLSKAGMEPSQLLTCHRVEDLGNNLWIAFNRVHENLTGGGMRRRAHTGRLTRTRRITSIRESVRLNGGLWDLATDALAA